MPFFYHKRIGTKNVSTGITVDRHGIRRSPWTFRLGRCFCFK